MELMQTDKKNSMHGCQQWWRMWVSHSVASFLLTYMQEDNTVQKLRGNWLDRHWLNKRQELKRDVSLRSHRCPLVNNGRHWFTSIRNKPSQKGACMSSDRQDSKEKLPFIVIPMLDPSVRTKGGILIGFQVNSNNSYFINSNFILFW